MSFPLLVSPPTWALLLSLAAHMAAGIVFGVLYFGSLWWNIRQFIGGGRSAKTIAVMIGRFTLLAGLLILASMEGAPSLLSLVLGVIIARFTLMRTIRQTGP